MTELDVIEEAVHALLPIVPVVGSWNQGYSVSDKIDPVLAATPEEWADAADAVVKLHQIVREVRV